MLHGQTTKKMSAPAVSLAVIKRSGNVNVGPGCTLTASTFLWLSNDGVFVVLNVMQLWCVCGDVTMAISNTDS